MTAQPPDDEVASVAARHGFSPAAMSALRDAIRRGGGRMAQFSHPELGGMGQWSGGGLLQIGAIFDAALKARVAAACADLAGAVARSEPSGDDAPGASWQRQSQGRAEPASAAEPVNWWGSDLGRPSASGFQDGSRYAYFPETRRLAVERLGRVTIYDTGRHSIFGVSQSHSRGPHLAFTADDGTVDLEALRIIET